MSREMQRVMRDGRQFTVECPRCERMVGFWLCIQEPGEYARDHATTDITAAVLPPAERAAAMRQSAEFAEKSTATPWVTCLGCGYDDHYVIPAPTP